MIINGILTEVKNHFQEKIQAAEAAGETDNRVLKDLMEMHIHTWNLFFSLTELSKGDLDSEI